MVTLGFIITAYFKAGFVALSFVPGTDAFLSGDNAQEKPLVWQQHVPFGKVSQAWQRLVHPRGSDREHQHRLLQQHGHYLPIRTYSYTSLSTDAALFSGQGVCALIAQLAKVGAPILTGRHPAAQHDQPHPLIHPSVPFHFQCVWSVLLQGLD